MPKSKNASGKNEAAQDSQKLYARAYASRLAKQVGNELESSRRATTPRRKSAAKS